MWKILANKNLKTLIIIQSAKYNKVRVDPYKFYGDSDTECLVNYYEGLTTAGFCETVLFADYCSRNKIVFDEIHYQWNYPTNMPTQQIASILEKTNVIKNKKDEKIKWSGDLKSNIDVHNRCYSDNKTTEPISSKSKIVLYVVNNGVLKDQIKTRAVLGDTEGLVLQASEWKDIFEKPIRRMRLKTTLLRKPDTDSANVWHRIKEENPKFMHGVRGLDIHHPEYLIAVSNDKVFDLSAKTIKKLIQSIKKHYTWYLEK